MNAFPGFSICILTAAISERLVAGPDWILAVEVQA
jgi:hypothetical protein